MSAEMGLSGWGTMRAELAQYGGITVMIPAATIIAVWLWYSNLRALDLVTYSALLCVTSSRQEGS